MGVRDLFKLDGRGALVTGGSRGLGLPMAEAQRRLQGQGGGEDLKGTVVLLASEAARRITAQYLAVDGDNSIVRRTPS